MRQLSGFSMARPASNNINSEGKYAAFFAGIEGYRGIKMLIGEKENRPSERS